MFRFGVREGLNCTRGQKRKCWRQVGAGMVKSAGSRKHRFQRLAESREQGEGNLLMKLVMLREMYCHARCSLVLSSSDWWWVARLCWGWSARRPPWANDFVGVRVAGVVRGE